MSVNFKTLRSFIVALECEGLSAAAHHLGIGQATLSQHIAATELHFGQRLFHRTSTGVTPTAAGKILYRHAQTLMSQLEQAEQEVKHADESLSGQVTIGLATYSSISSLAMPLFLAIRDHAPGIQLFLDDNYGLVLSELVMSGKMDLAVFYGSNDIVGVEQRPLLVEDLFAIGHPALLGDTTPGIDAMGTMDGRRAMSSSEMSRSEMGSRAMGNTVPLAALEDVPLLLPTRKHLLRRIIDAGFNRLGIRPRLVAEIESADTLSAAIAEGVGVTILPWAFAQQIPEVQAAGFVPSVRRIVSPELTATVSLCLPNGSQRLSSPAALAVAEHVTHLVRGLLRSPDISGLHPLAKI